MARLGKRLVQRRGTYQRAWAGGAIFEAPFSGFTLNLEAVSDSVTVDSTTITADSTTPTADAT